MIRFLIFPAVCGLFFLIQSCATVPRKPVHPDDPLVGKILDTRTGKMVSFSQLMTLLMDHGVIYLSEKHHNPMHHAIQHRVIRYLVEHAGTPPVLGFEFFAVHDTPLLLSFVESGLHSHGEKMNAMIEADLKRQLNWEHQSDQMWGYYFDLLTLARDHGLAAAGLDLSGPLKRRITRKGCNGLTGIETYQVFSTGLDNPAYAAYMKAVFRTVHCGMGDDAMLDRLMTPGWPGTIPWPSPLPGWPMTLPERWW